MMAWVKVNQQSEVTYTLSASGNPFNPSHTVTMRDGMILPDGGFARAESWSLTFSKPCRIAVSLTADPVRPPNGAVVSGGFFAGDINARYAEVLVGGEIWQVILDSPQFALIDSVVEVDSLIYEPAFDPPNNEELPNHYNCHVYVWEYDDGGSDPVEDLVFPSQPSMVYEFEKGWGFDGKYIPHFVELNWWFGDSPVINTGIQKLRVHGLSKGKANLTLAVNSMSEPRLSYDEDYSEPQWIDLPREQVPPTADFVPVTNYTDTASRGISTQLKFEGRPDTTLEVPPPEPPHVLQVLVIQGSPAGTGATSN